MCILYVYVKRSQNLFFQYTMKYEYKILKHENSIKSNTFMKIVSPSLLLWTFILIMKCYYYIIYTLKYLFHKGEFKVFICILLCILKQIRKEFYPWFKYLFCTLYGWCVPTSGALVFCLPNKYSSQNLLCLKVSSQRRGGKLLQIQFSNIKPLLWEIVQNSLKIQ